MSALEPLDAVGARIHALGARIDAPDDLLPTLRRTEDSARPHIEVDARYHWVVVERGEELERRSTDDLDQLLYWTFESACFSMACSYELHHRASGQDTRPIMFARQCALLGALDPAWAHACAARQAAVLAEHPFTDGLDRVPPTARPSILARLFRSRS